MVSILVSRTVFRSASSECPSHRVSRAQSPGSGETLASNRPLHHNLSGARFLSIEPREKIGIALRQLAVNLQTRFRPAADPLAVVQIRPLRRAVADVRFVIAAAGAERTRPTR